MPARSRKVKRAKTPAQRKKINAKRDYKKEYKRDQSSAKRRKYRSKLTQARRKRGIAGKGGNDVIHKGGKIVGTGSRYQNRADGARKATKKRVANKRKKKK